MPPPRNLVGHKPGEFGRWTVVRLEGRRGCHRLWLCRCECGGESLLTTSNLTSGHSRQCRRCADTFAGHGTPAAARPKQAKSCIWCGKSCLLKLNRRWLCSPECRAAWKWARKAADPAKRAAHSRQITANQRAANGRRAATKLAGMAAELERRMADEQDSDKP